MGRKVNAGHWNWLLCGFLVLVCWSVTRAETMAAVEEEAEDGGEEAEGSPEYLWQFQELLKCTMGIDGIMELLARYNCSECQT